MSLFDKKYDVDKDKLMRQFSPEKGYYYVKVIAGKKVKIDSSELNSKTNRLLKKENQELSSNPVDKDHYVDRLVTKDDLKTDVIQNKK